MSWPDVVPEYDLNPAPDGSASAVVLHPHPAYGGDRFNNVVTALYEALPTVGVTTARFDFTSADVDTCAAEAKAVLAAVEPRPRFLVGYSFGGGVAATVAEPELAGWLLVAPALSLVAPTIGADQRPKLVIAAAHDQFFPPAAVTAATDEWRATERVTVTGADHFFVGRTDAVVDATLRWLSTISR